MTDIATRAKQIARARATYAAKRKAERQRQVSTPKRVERPKATTTAKAKPNGHGSPQPLRKLFTLTPAIDKALTRRATARSIPEAWIVRNALREVLGVDEAKER